MLFIKSKCDQSSPKTPSSLLLTIAVTYKESSYLLLYLGSSSLLKQVWPFGYGFILSSGADYIKNLE